jgi:hypothetical protein
MRECKGNMPEDILTAGMYPRDEIFNNSFLAPSPLLTAFTALHAVLGGRHISSLSYNELKYLIIVIF